MGNEVRSAALKALVLGVAIEIPLILWFNSTQGDAHISMVPGILFVFHLPSYFLMRLILLPFEGHLSDTAFNSLGISLMAIFQAVLIASIVFPKFRRRMD